MSYYNVEGANQLIFEQQTFKVPYEEFNQSYRINHKNVERSSYQVRHASANLRSQLKKEGNECVDVRPVADAFTALRQKIAEARAVLQDSLQKEKDFALLLHKRVDQLNTEAKPTSSSVENWYNFHTRSNRLILQYLLRRGSFTTAELLIEKTGLRYMVDVDVFKKFFEVRNSLYSHELDHCLKWIVEHRQRLRKINSELETRVRIQAVVEMVRGGKSYQAVLYARKHLPMKSADEYREVLHVWGLLGLGPSSICEHKRLLRDERWNELAELFRKDFVDLYQLSKVSPFAMCLQCGISAYKTPECSAGRENKCPACDRLVYALSHNLPHAHTGQSRLHCAFTGDPLNEDNPPWMLDTGRVYGQKALELLTSETHIQCPITQTWVPRDKCYRLYIL